MSRKEYDKIYIKPNFSYYYIDFEYQSTSEGFLGLNIGDLIVILSHTCLHVTNEMLVVDALAKWMNANPHCWYDQERRYNANMHHIPPL